MDKVIDIKTKAPLFCDETRSKLQDGIKPYLRDDATEAMRAQVVNTVEQVLCTAIVTAARNLAVALVEKLASKFAPETKTPDVTPEV